MNRNVVGNIVMDGLPVVMNGGPVVMEGETMALDGYLWS